MHVYYTLVPELLLYLYKYTLIHFVISVVNFIITFMLRPKIRLLIIISIYFTVCNLISAKHMQTCVDYRTSILYNKQAILNLISLNFLRYNALFYYMKRKTLLDFWCKNDVRKHQDYASKISKTGLCNACNKNLFYLMRASLFMILRIFTVCIICSIY